MKGKSSTQRIAQGRGVSRTRVPLYRLQTCVVLVLGVVEVQWAESCRLLMKKRCGRSLGLSSLAMPDCSPLMMMAGEKSY